MRYTGRDIRINARHMNTDLLRRVQSLVSRVTGKDAESIQPEMNIDDLVVDSIELFRLIMAFEEEFEQRADYKELMKIETVADIVAYLDRLR